MSNISLAIIYRPDDGRPVVVADVASRAVVTVAAETALAEADERATHSIDPTTATIRQADADRLRRVLGLLLPEMQMSTDVRRLLLA